MGKITILDVAHSAGVSVATVDRVLNRRTGVRKVTVERVEAAIRQLNYQPDRLAARLARSRDYHFCFVLPTGNNTFMVSLGEEVHAAAGIVEADEIWMFFQDLCRHFLDALPVIAAFADREDREMRIFMRHDLLEAELALDVIAQRQRARDEADFATPVA